MKKENSGFVLIIVIYFTAIASILVAGLLMESNTQLKISRRQTDMERVFYVAEGAAEQAVAYIRNGGAVPGMITGTIGNGKYITSIMGIDQMSGTGGTHTVSGAININPNNSPDNEFLLVTSDGSVLSRDDLHQDQSDYTDVAYLMHVKPKGNGNQNSLTVDGVTYTLNNNTAYTFSSVGMAFNLYNDNRNPQGKAVGHWWININGSPISINDDSTSGTPNNYSIFSIGTVNDTKRVVILEGVHQESWAKYALWYNADAYGCWFKSDEKFYGPIHANCQANFDGNPEFFALLSTAQSTYGGSTNAVIFHEGFTLDAPYGSMASVSFTGLLLNASMVLTGETSIAMADTNVLITNPRMGWTNHAVTLPDDSLVYVETASSGPNTEGTVQVGGTLDGRLTIVADYDIKITNSINYAVHPTNSSDDALGLIAGRNVRIETNCPDNVNVYAHVMATGNATASTADGMFYVDQYNSPPPRGTLSVYGGIVQYTRGPVGMFYFGGEQYSGFDKNYIFDTRFSTTPPPNYPTITNEYIWSQWRDMAP